MSELKFIYLAKFLLLSPTFFNLVHRKNTKRGMQRYYHEVAVSLSLSLSAQQEFILCTRQYFYQSDSDQIELARAVNLLLSFF